MFRVSLEYVGPGTKKVLQQNKTDVKPSKHREICLRALNEQKDYKK